MRYWKRLDAQGKVTTVESYSHNLPIAGAVEIDETEFNSLLTAMQNSPETIAAQQVEQTKATKRAAANIRALAAIEANKTGAPWGVILHDIAIAQGWVEP